MEHDIGSKIKAARIEKKLTQEQVAELLGVSRQTISNWENEKSYPDIISVIELSNLYSISLDVLLKGDEKMIEHLEESTNVVKSNQKDAGPSDSSISENLVEKASDKKASDKTDNDSDGRKKETVNSVAANGPIEEKNGLTLNSYTGHGLDGSTYGTKEIFSTMKSSTLPTYGECFIVAVNNETTGEVIKIFSATGYELKMAFAGNCLDDVLERIDID